MKKCSLFNIIQLLECCEPSMINQCLDSILLYKEELECNEPNSAGFQSIWEDKILCLDTIEVLIEEYRSEENPKSENAVDILYELKSELRDYQYTYGGFKSRYIE